MAMVGWGCLQERGCCYEGLFLMELRGWRGGGLVVRSGEKRVWGGGKGNGEWGET